MTTLYTVRPGPVLHIWDNGREVAQFTFSPSELLGLIANLTAAVRMDETSGGQMSNVFSLHGGAITEPGKPDPDLVAALEYVLEEAKSGALSAIAFCVVKGNSAVGTGWCGAEGTQHAISSGLLMLQHEYAAAMLEPDE